MQVPTRGHCEFWGGQVRPDHPTLSGFKKPQGDFLGGQCHAHQAHWSSTNYQPPGLLPNFCPTLGVRVILRCWLVALQLSVTSQLASHWIQFHCHWFLKEQCALRDQVTLPTISPWTLVPSNPGSAPSLPQACLWQPHPLKDPRFGFSATYGSRRRQRIPEPALPETGTRRWTHFLVWWWNQGPHSHSSRLTGRRPLPRFLPTPSRATHMT